MPDGPRCVRGKRIGTTHPERIVIAGSHYDSRTIDVSDGTSPAPGANDSGSQTALVLELARAFAGHAFDATVAFIAFAEKNREWSDRELWTK